MPKVTESSKWQSWEANLGPQAQSPHSTLTFTVKRAHDFVFSGPTRLRKGRWALMRAPGGKKSAFVEPRLARQCAGPDVATSQTGQAPGNNTSVCKPLWLELDVLPLSSSEFKPSVTWSMACHVTEQFLFPGAFVGSSRDALVNMAVFSGVKNQPLQSPHLLLSVNQNSDQGLPPTHPFELFQVEPKGEI